MSLDQHFVETSEAILAQLGFKDLKSFVKNQALLLILAKIEKYQAEDRLLEKKYKIDFERFQEKIKNLKNEEVFEQEDDYLDWRYARESLDRLKTQKQALEHA
jgi:hypothetical protein